MTTRSLLTIGGAIIGSFFGAPQLGLVIGALVGNAVDPVKVFGPRLSDSKIQTARDGVPINWGAGQFRCAGTIIAVQPGPPTEHEHEEGGKGFGGPEQVTYTYTRTHAILVCEGPVVGIRRIWRDQKLVYDTTAQPTEATPSTPLEALVAAWTAGQAATSEFREQLTIYLGDESQLPDPELEAIFGVGEYPAHRGYCYVVIKDDDVTERGGSISNYEFEVARAGTASSGDYLADLGPVFYYKLNDTGASAVDSAPVPRADLPFGGDYSTGTGGVTFNDDTGRAGVSQSSGLDGLDEYTIFVRVNVDNSTPPTHQQQVFAVVNNVLLGYVQFGFYLANPSHMLPFFVVNGMAGTGIQMVGSEDLAFNRTYVLGIRRRDTFVDMIIDGEVVDTVACTGTFGGIGQFVFGASSGYADGTPGVASNGIAYARALTDAEVKQVAYYQSIVPAGGVPLPGSAGWVALPDGSVVSVGGGNEAINPDAVLLSEFVTTVCERSGLAASDLDVSELDDWMIGFLVARESQGDALLNVLAQAFFFDVCEQDGLLVFRKRGGASQLTLDEDDLVSVEGPPVRETRDQEIERARKINVVYFDPDLQYIPSKQTAERRATVSAVGETSLELPIVFDKDAAAQIADKLIKLSWTDQLGTCSFSLPDEFSYLVPADVIQLDYRDRVQRLRIEKIDEEAGVLMVQARQDRLSALDSTATGIGDPQSPQYPAPIGPTVFAVMNLPALRQQDNTPGVYMVARGLLQPWPGCMVQVSYDGGATWQNGVTISSNSTMGELTAPVDDPANSPASESIAINVTGELSSVTDAQIDAGYNTFAIVDASDVAEIGQCKTVVDQGDGDYLLTDPTRGALGTEAVSHATGEGFYMLTSAVFFPVDETFTGTTLYFRAVTLGSNPEGAEVVTLVYSPWPVEIIIDGGGAPL